MKKVLILCSSFLLSSCCTLDMLLDPYGPPAHPHYYRSTPPPPAHRHHCSIEVEQQDALDMAVVEIESDNIQTKSES